MSEKQSPIQKLKARLTESKQRIAVEVADGVTIYIQEPGLHTLSQSIQFGKLEAARRLAAYDEDLKRQPIDPDEWNAFLSRNTPEGQSVDETIKTLEQYGVPKNPNTQYDMEHARLAQEIAGVYTMAAYIHDEEGDPYCVDAESRDFILGNVITTQTLPAILAAKEELEGNPDPTSPNSLDSQHNGQTAGSEAKPLIES